MTCFSAPSLGMLYWFAMISALLWSERKKSVMIRVDKFMPVAGINRFLPWQKTGKKKPGKKPAAIN